MLALVACVLATPPLRAAETFGPLKNITCAVRVNGEDVTASSDTVKLELKSEPIPGNDGAIVEAIVTNLSKADLNIPQIDIRGAVRLAATKVLTNGYIYYDSGRLLEFSQGKKIDSFWDAAFYQPDPRRVLVAGYLDNDFAEGHILAQRRGDGTTFDVTARSLLHPTFLLKPGQSISSGKVMLLVSDDPWGALEFYADTIAKVHHVKLNPVINGWCSWFVYYGGVSEDEVLKNAVFVAKELKPYGMEWIQIDDGYYRGFGDWEGNNRFPHGMKHAADEIRKLGLKPGLWIAPYAISENAPIAKEHPDWLAHEPDGSLQRIESAHQGQAQLILDVTHPAARDWLAKLVKTITNDWGYDFIKTDFVEWTILAQHQFHDRSLTKAQAYRLGDYVMRDAMGKDRHFLDCGPGNEAVGLIDSMRIGLDRPDDLPNFKLYQQYFGSYNATIPSVAKRYYFGGRTWINDPDHLRLAKQTIAQGQAAATAVALSGGTTISGDKLYELDRARLDILKKVLPAYGGGGVAARPIDLFDNPLPEQFALPVRTSWGDWTIVASFNSSDKAARRRIRFADAFLDARKTYLVYDFWAQKWLGEFTDEYPVSIEPTSVSLVAVREKSGKPQVLSTDRHVIQGAVELENVRFDDAGNVLSGTAIGAPGMWWRLAIYCPSGYRLPAERSAAASNLADITYEAPLLRARVRFDDPHAGKVNWSVRFEKS